MEVSALCVRLLINVLMLLAAEVCFCAEKAYAAFLCIVPNRLQLFEYESISFDCEGFDDFTQWRVMRRFLGVKTICGRYEDISRGSCVIKNAFASDSGEYWCEAKGRERGNSANIIVTAGPVILESPALPVTVGDDVTLSCRSKMTSYVHVANFYKDGILTQTGYKGVMTMHSVSKSDEGLYKCNINGVGESAESWLAVQDEPQNDKEPNLFILWVSMALLFAALLLLLGLCLCRKHKVLACVSSETSPPISHSHEAETVSGLTSVVHPQTDIYSCITANTICTAEAGAPSCTVTPVVDTPSAGTYQSTKEYSYYTIDYVRITGPL